jgi:hypothetical protein
MKKRIEERIVESGLFSFDDGYLGSTNHCVNYYYDWGVGMMNKIKDESNLKSLLLDKEFMGDIWNEEIGDYIEVEWDKFFDEWFGDCDDWEIIEDSINGGRGYGKIVVDKVNKTIEIMVVPCLYSDWDSDKESDIKIFGFDWVSGELVREIGEKELEEMLKDKDYFIG